MEEDSGYTVIREGILSVREFHFSIEEWQLSKEAMLCQKAKGKGQFTKDDVMAMKEKLAEENKRLNADDELKSNDKKKQQKIEKDLEIEKKKLIRYQIEATKKYINMVETKYKEEQKRLRVEWAKILRENKQKERENQKRQRKIRKGKGKQNKENNKKDTKVEAEQTNDDEKSSSKMDTASVIGKVDTTTFKEKTEKSTLKGGEGDFNNDGLKPAEITDVCETTATSLGSNNIVSRTSTADAGTCNDKLSPDVAKQERNYGNNDKKANEINCPFESKQNGDGAYTCPVLRRVDVEHSLSTNDITVDVGHSLSTNDITVDVGHSLSTNDIIVDVGHSLSTNDITVGVGHANDITVDVGHTNDITVDVAHSQSTNDITVDVAHSLNTDDRTVNVKHSGNDITVDVAHSLSTDNITVVCSTTDGVEYKTTTINGAVSTDEHVTVGGNNMIIPGAYMYTSDDEHQVSTSIVDKEMEEFKDTLEDNRNLKAQDKKAKKNTQGCFCGLFRRLFARKKLATHQQSDDE